MQKLQILVVHKGSKAYDLQSEEKRLEVQPVATMMEVQLVAPTMEGSAVLTSKVRLRVPHDGSPQVAMHERVEIHIVVDRDADQVVENDQKLLERFHLQHQSLL